MHKHCFFNVAFIFCPSKLCSLRETGIAIKIILQFEKGRKQCVSYIHLHPPKNNLMFNFSKTGA